MEGRCRLRRSTTATCPASRCKRAINGGSISQNRVFCRGKNWKNHKQIKMSCPVSPFIAIVGPINGLARIHECFFWLVRIIGYLPFSVDRENVAARDFSDGYRVTCAFLLGSIAQSDPTACTIGASLAIPTKTIFPVPPALACIGAAPAAFRYCLNVTKPAS